MRPNIPANRIGPLGAWEFRGDEIEARLQRRPALRARQPFDLAKRDFSAITGCGIAMSAGSGCGQSFDDGRAAFHERRKGIGSTRRSDSQSRRGSC